MKIWKASLVLFYNIDDEWESRFIFELQDKPFDINIYVPDEWIYREGWLSTRIPMIMEVEQIVSGYKVVQGFDHDLSKEELMKKGINICDDHVDFMIGTKDLLII